MFSRLLIIAMLSFVLVAATACSSGDTPTAVPESTVPTEITQLAQELPALTDLGPGQDARQTSAVTQYIQLDQCSYLSNAVVSPTSVELPSAATQMSAAWWGITLSYQVNSSPDVYLPVPYLAPYEVRITASGSGEYWVALPDYKLGCWNFLPDKYASGNVTIPVGLEPNAGSLAGTFTIAIITYGGSDITVTEIAMDFPEPLNSTQAQPIEYQQMIEAADGTELATTVFLPYYETSPLIPNPPYPVVLFRTPYDKDEVLNTEYQGQGLPSALALANIVMIAQYHRGRFNDSGAWPDSGGTETLFRDHAGPDHTDAIDTMDWIEGRQWYNGTTVLSGPSALGLWIYQAAPVLGDRIAAIYPQVSSGNVGNWAAMRFGCFKRSNVEGWIVGNSYPPALLTEAETQFNNEAYWTAIDFDDDAGDVTCPGYHEVGWWDVDV
ncbi:hypothetical protein JW859_05780 [bacterium]|nr:hypothetical protein [bacterium]